MNPLWLIGVTALALLQPPTLAAASVSYNLRDYQTPLTTRVSLPGDWRPGPAPDYRGTLDAYWWATLKPGEKTLVSKTAALGLGLPVDFSLYTAPDNCWGMFMGFGLVTLSEPSDLRITVTADEAHASAVVPAFAVFQGWDLSQSASRHLTVTFGTNNPLGTEGLLFLTDSYSENLGTTASKTLASLPAGAYEVFITSRGNTGASGPYEVQLEAFAPGSQPRPSAVDTSLCGSLANQTFAANDAALDQLCRYGKPRTALTPLKDGRLTWLCGGPGSSPEAARCYTKAPGKKQNQAPLTLRPETTVATQGQPIRLSGEGGSGKGTLSFIVTGRTQGTRCKLKPHGSTATLLIEGNPGTCRIIARKRSDPLYLDVESAPVEIRRAP